MIIPYQYSAILAKSARKLLNLTYTLSYMCLYAFCSSCYPGKNCKKTVFLHKDSFGLGYVS